MFRRGPRSNLRFGADRTRQNVCLLCKNKTVSQCCRRVRPACFALTKFCRTLPNFKEAATKILSGDFIALFFLFSVRKSIRTFQRSNRYGITLIQKRAKLKSTSLQQAWTERISLAFRTKIWFSAVLRSSWRWAMSLLTDEQEQRGSSFNYYMHLPNFFKPDHKRRTKFKVYLPRTYFFCCRCRLCSCWTEETVWNIDSRKGEELRVTEMDIWEGQTIWLTF